MKVDLRSKLRRKSKTWLERYSSPCTSRYLDYPRILVFWTLVRCLERNTKRDTDNNHFPGITWAYVIGVISVAFFAKFLGCSLAARLNGLVWRESFSIGALMSCKGLVELIVLNIGLQAKILSTRTFTIFVVMALVTTFATTPLTRALYPPWYQRKLEAWKRGEIDWDSGEPLLDGSRDEPDIVTQQKMESSRIKSLMVYLRLDNMPTTLAFVSLLGGRSTQSEGKLHPTRSMGEKGVQPNHDSQTEERRKRVQVHGLMLIELTERGYAVMRVAEVDEYSAFDPVLNIFRVLGVSGEAAIIPQSSYADTLVTRAAEESSDLLILPWSGNRQYGRSANDHQG